MRPSSQSPATGAKRPALLATALVFHGVGATQLKPNFCRARKKKENVFLLPPLEKYCSLSSHEQQDVVYLECGIMFLDKSFKEGYF